MRLTKAREAIIAITHSVGAAVSDAISLTTAFPQALAVAASADQSKLDAALSVLGGPVGLIAFSTVLVASGVYKALGDLKQGDRIEDTRQMVQLLLSEFGGLERGAEAIIRESGIEVKDLPSWDQHNLAIVLQRLIELRFEQLTDLTTASSAVAARKTDALRQHVTEALDRHAQFELRIARELDRRISHVHDALNRLGARIEDLRDEVRAALEVTSRSLHARTTYPPPLLLPVYGSTGQNPLFYGVRRVPVFGREAEQAELRAFLDDPTPTSWWLCTAPGGAGKSRLALELCLDAVSRGWAAGFLQRDTDYADWHRWSPDRPTLLVADYAAGRAKQIGDALQVLAERSRRDSPAVRILLLERPLPPSGLSIKTWLGDFWEQGSESRKAAIRSIQFRPDAGSMHIGLLKEEAIWSIFCHILTEKEVPPPKREQVIRMFGTLDSQSRPLFAALAADAIAERGLTAVRSWDAKKLVTQLVNTEVGRWKHQAGLSGDLFERHLNLLAAVTMTGGVMGGLGIDTVCRGALKELLPDSSSFDEHAYRVLTSLSAVDQQADSVNELGALEPDIVGECFVLERLAGNLRASDTPHGRARRSGQQLLVETWKRAGFTMVGFLGRAITDFPSHPELLQFAKLDDVDIKDPRFASIHRHAWAAVGVMGLVPLIESGNEAASTRWFEGIQRIAADHPSDGELLSFAASARVNRAVASAQRLSSGKHEAIIESLTPLIEDPRTPRYQRAVGLINRAEAHRLLDQEAFSQMTEADCAIPLDHIEAAIPDFTAFLAADNGSASDRLAAHSGRAWCFRRRAGPGDLDSALADLTAIVTNSAASPDQQMHALRERARVYFTRHGPEDEAAGLADCEAVIASSTAAADDRAEALLCRGIPVARAFLEAKPPDREAMQRYVNDLRSVLALKDASVRLRAGAAIELARFAPRDKPEIAREMLEWAKLHMTRCGDRAGVEMAETGLRYLNQPRQ